MNKIILLISSLLIFSGMSYGQSKQEKLIYIVDSIPVWEEISEEEGAMNPDEIDHVFILKNKDSLQLLGFDKMDAAIYVFTKAYVSRPEDIKRIVTSKRMIRRDGKWYLKGSDTPYSGPFIDYYYNGKKQGEGVFREGLLYGHRAQYYLSGNMSSERVYVDGIENGIEKEYYTDGSLKQKGEFKNGVEVGVWEKYFPNGQVKQRNTFVNGKMEGESFLYYSTGKLMTREVIKNGKVTADPALEKINKFYAKGVEAEKEGNFKQAYKQYAKCIEVDSTYAMAYFAMGTSRLNDQQYDAAIAEYDKALIYEPYLEYVLTNRAISLIQKYQPSRTLSTNQYVTIMATKKATIPEDVLARMCTDLQRALLLSPTSERAKKIVAEYCK